MNGRRVQGHRRVHRRGRYPGLRTGGGVGARTLVLALTKLAGRIAHNTARYDRAGSGRSPQPVQGRELTEVAVALVEPDHVGAAVDAFTREFYGAAFDDVHVVAAVALVEQDLVRVERAFDATVGRRRTRAQMHHTIRERQQTLVVRRNDDDAAAR